MDLKVQLEDCIDHDKVDRGVDLEGISAINELVAGLSGHSSEWDEIKSILLSIAEHLSHYNDEIDMLSQFIDYFCDLVKRISEKSKVIVLNVLLALHRHLIEGDSESTVSVDIYQDIMYTLTAIWMRLVHLTENLIASPPSTPHYSFLLDDPFIQSVVFIFHLLTSFAVKEVRVKVQGLLNPSPMEELAFIRSAAHSLSESNYPQHLLPAELRDYEGDSHWIPSHEQKKELISHQKMKDTLLSIHAILQSVHRNKKAKETFDHYRDNICSLVFISLAKWWDGYINDPNRSHTLTNTDVSISISLYTVNTTLYLFHSSPRPLSLSSTAWACLSPIALHLIEHHATAAQVYGQYLLRAMSLLTNRGVLLPTVQWLGEKMLNCYKMNDVVLAKVISLRTQQMWFASSERDVQVVLLCHVFVQEVLEDMSRDFVAQRLWSSLLCLPLFLRWISVEMVASHSDLLVQTLFHVLNLHHLPTQVLSLQCMETLLQRIPEDFLGVHSMELFTELSRAFLFYRRVLAKESVDLSNSPSSLVKEIVEQIVRVGRESSLKNPKGYREWKGSILKDVGEMDSKNKDVIFVRECLGEIMKEIEREREEAEEEETRQRKEEIELDSLD